MRKIITILVVSLLVFPIYAQNVNYIKLSSNWWEFMTQEDEFYPKGQTHFGVSWQVCNDLCDSIPDTKFHFFLILSYKSYNDSENIPFGGKLLLKTTKDEIISASNVADYKIITYDPKDGFQRSLYTHEYVDGGYISSYINRGKYEISQENIVKLATDGVVKIRIETNSESIDINLPATEQVKVGKKHDMNKFALSAIKLASYTDQIFEPETNF